MTSPLSQRQVPCVSRPLVCLCPILHILAPSITVLWDMSVTEPNITFPLRGINTRPLSRSELVAEAESEDIPISHLLAVIKVEAAGRGFSSSGLLKILYEPHIAWRETEGATRDALVKYNLAYKRWGEEPYPQSMAARHWQLSTAYEIAGERALEWASYGLAQIMGLNYRQSGFSSVTQMVNFLLISEANQLLSMIKFLKSTGLIYDIRKGHWDNFALRYNGPSFARNRYQIRLEQAVRFYDQHPMTGAIGNQIAAQSSPYGLLKEAQHDLTTLGYNPGPADGWLGTKTTSAILTFQKSDSSLVTDGILGPDTMAAIHSAMEMRKKQRSKKVTNTAMAGSGIAAASTAAKVNSHWWIWIVARLRGWKTHIFAVLVATAGLLHEYGYEFIPPQYFGKVMFAIGIILVLLRQISNTDLQK